MINKEYIILLIIFGMLFFSFCGETGNYSDNYICKDDSDCQIKGCSGEICQSKSQSKRITGVGTTCVYRKEYDCLKHSSCKCINEMCQWEQINTT